MYIYPPRPTFLWFLLVFAVNYAHFELIFLVAVLGHVLVDLWRVPYSSTTQGGGGSFKNRKPIGEIGCCESGMAERSH